MNHNDIRHRLSEYLDGSITGQDKTEIEDHLKTCPKCENALNELRKTIEHVKSVEEIDPPAWMTQKIMAKVRAAADEKKGLFQQLFFPLALKLPIQAVAVVFLTITAFYIYRDTQPTSKFAEAPVSSNQELTFRKEAPAAPSANREISKADDSLLRSKQVPQTPEYKSLDMKPEYETPPPPVLKGKLAETAPATAPPAEQPAPEKYEMMQEKRAASTQAPALGMVKKEAPASAGAAPQMKAKRQAASSLEQAKEVADTAGTGHRLERDITEKHANGNPKTIITYEIIDSQKKKLAEEHFTSDGERHGMQKEYYATGQLKTEARYGYGKLEWYMEYGTDGVKKVGRSDYDWFWLKK